MRSTRAITFLVSNETEPMNSRFPFASQSHTSILIFCPLSSSYAPTTKSNSSSHTGLSVSRFVAEAVA